MYLRTLGGLSLEGATLGRRKPLLLLAFLALEGSRSRREVAELFWMGARDPRDSLSTALRRLNGGGRACVAARGDRLATELPCDATAFLRALHERDPLAALERYGGPFLDGLDLSLGLELEEWVFATRERLARLARRAHLRAARDLLGVDVPAAGRVAEGALDVRHAPPWDEEDLIELAGLLRACGSERSAELEREAGELGVPLAARPAPPGPPRSNLPHVATTFVGREDERRALEELLRGPTARLVTLHGPGGIGKSRLAIEVAHRLLAQDAALEGAVFVALEEVRDPRLLPAALADALGLPLVPQVPEEAQVLAFLEARPLLLVLDNVEHLAHEPGFAARLVRACPNLRLLVTSRQRLALPEEHLLPLAGLPTGTPLERGDALRLLLDRIAQVRPGASLDPEEDLAAHRVCELLHGVPLALELAAAWTRALPLPQVEAELRHDLDLLEAAEPRAPERARGLRAGFEVSWRLLDDEEQRALRRTSVFRGGFARDAARAVAGAELNVLTRLVDKALLRAGPSGRFERHPLVHRYAAEKLAEDRDEEREARDRHARWILEAARRRGEAGMGGPDVKDAWGWYAREFANLEAAWRHALADVATYRELLDDVAWYLAHYAEQTGRFRDARSLYRLVPAGADPLLYATVVAESAWHSMRLGELDAALEEAGRGRELLAPFGEEGTFRGLWSVHEGALGAHATAGNFPEALHHARAAVAAAEREIDRHPAGSPPKDAEIALGLSLTAWAWSHTWRGEYGEAAPLVRRARELLGRHASGGLGFALHLEGQLALYTARPHEALARLDEALAWTRGVGFETQEAQILGDLAQARMLLGDLVGAEASCRSGLAITRRNGNRWHETMLHATLGRVLLASGREPDAVAAFGDAARVGLASGVAAYAAEALVGLAERHAARGDRDRAAELLAAVRAEAGIPAAARDLAAHVATRHDLPAPPEPRPLHRWLAELAAGRGVATG